LSLAQSASRPAAKRAFFVRGRGGLDTLPAHRRSFVSVLYQDRKTGKRVRRVGGGSLKDDFVLVKGNDNNAYWASLEQLLPCDEATGAVDFDHAYVKPDDPEEAIPEPVVSLVETRLNINMATAEEIAKRVPGIGYRVAKKIKELQLNQPGEVYRHLDQIKAASPRVNWDEVLRANQLFIG
jgi:hypothetical protein